MLEPHQLANAEKGIKILQEFGMVYLSMETRTGKTRTSLKIAELGNFKNVLCLTKKDAIEDFVTQYKEEGFNYKLTVLNYEQLHKVSPEFDLYILDEAHSLGAFPKPSEKTKKLKKLIGSTPVVYASGTPWSESGSQLFHQFWISKRSPFSQNVFYKWAVEFVNIKKEMRQGNLINNYKNAKFDVIIPKIQHLLIKTTQKEAGFKNTEIIEEIKFVKPDSRVYSLVDLILKDGVYTFKDGKSIVCDTAVKKQSKIHQIFSGTVKTECGDYKILDYSKANYIKENYKGKKIAIFFKFIAEGKALKDVFPNWTDSAKEFNNSNDLVYIKQIQSGSMGVNLASADVLIFYNIDFSVMQYIQAKARIQNMRKETAAIIHWIFTENGIESKIYQTLQKKESYTIFYFLQDFLYGKQNSERYNRVS